MSLTIDTLFSATGYCVVRPIAALAFGAERAMLLDRLYQLIHEPPNDVDIKDERGKRYVRISATWLRRRRSFWFWQKRNINKHLGELTKAGMLVRLSPDKSSPDRRQWTTLDNAKIEAYAKAQILRAIKEEGDFEIAQAMRNALRMHGHSSARVGHSHSRDGGHSSARLQQKEKEESSTTKGQAIIAHKPLFEALASLCVLEPKLSGKEIAEATGRLAEVNATPEQVAAFKAWWESDPWKMSHTPTPTLKQVQDNWQKAQKNIKPAPIDPAKVTWRTNGKQAPATKPTSNPNVRIAKNGVQVWVGE